MADEEKSPMEVQYGQMRGQDDSPRSRVQEILKRRGIKATPANGTVSLLRNPEPQTPEDKIVQPQDVKDPTVPDPEAKGPEGPATVGKGPLAPAPEAKAPTITELKSDERAGAASAAQAIAGGVVDSVEALGNAVLDLGNGLEDYLQEKGLTEQDFLDDSVRFDFGERIVPAQEEGIARLERQIVNYVVPFSMATKGLKALGVANQMVRFGVSSAATAYVAVDPNEERASDMVQKNPELLWPWLQALVEPVTEVLKTEPEDSKLMSRTKNMGEAIIIDGVFGAGIKAVSMFAKGVYATKIARNFTGRAKKMTARAEVVRAEEQAFDQQFTKDVASGKKRVSTKALADESEQLVDDVAKNTQKKPVKAGAAEVIEPPPKVDPKVQKKVDELLEQPDFVERMQVLVDEGRPLSKTETLAFGQKYLRQQEIVEETMRAAVATGRKSDIVAHLRARNNLTAMDNMFSPAGTAQGEALRARQTIINAASEKGFDRNSAAILTEEIELLGGDENLLRDLTLSLEHLNQSKSKVVAMHEIAKAGKGGSETFFDKLHKFRLAQMLTSPSTLALPVINAAWRVHTDVATRGLGALYSHAKNIGLKAVGKGGLPASERLFFAEAGEAYIGALEGLETEILMTVEGIVDGLRLSKRMKGSKFGQSLQKMQQTELYGKRVSKAKRIKSQEPRLTGFREANRIESGAFTGESLGLGPVVGKNLDMIAAGIARGSFSVLQTLDKSIGGMRYRMGLRALAAREAKAQGLHGLKYGAFVDDFVNKPKNLMGKRMKNLRGQAERDAKLESDEFRFLNKIGKKPGDRGFDQATKLNQKWGTIEDVMHWPGARILFPFARIGMNVLEQSLQHAPIVRGLSPKFQLAKAVGGQEWALAQGKLALGSTFATTMGVLAYNGKVTGKGPANRDQRKIWNEHAQEYSINIFGTWVSFDRFTEPVGRVMKVGADLGEMASFFYGENSDPDAKADFEEAIGQFISVAADTLKPEFLTDGLGDIIEALESPEKGKSMIDIAQDVAMSHIPLAGAQKFVRRKLDPIKRQTKVTGGEFQDILEERVNKLKNSIPGWSDTLVPQRNKFAEVVHYPPGLGIDMVSGIYTTDAKETKLSSELLRLGVAGPLMHPVPKVGEQQYVMRMPGKYMDRVIAGVNSPLALTIEQYDRRTLLQAGVDLKGAKQTLKEMMTETVENNYPQLRAGRKTDQNKRRVLALIVGTYAKNGDAQLKQELEDSGDFQILEHALDVENASQER